MMENNTKSTGKQKKKFTMPKFPSAIVVIGIVLLFSTFLTWIPHEGWINLDADSINIDLATGLITTSSGAPIANIIGPVSNSTITILLDESFVSFLIKSGWVDEGFLSSIPVIQITINFEITNTFSSASGSGDIIINSWIITNDGEIQEEVIVNVPLHLHYDATLEVFQIFGVSGSLTSDWIDFFNSGYYVSETGRYGIFNLPLVIIAGFFSASGVLLYIFCIGAFVEVMLQSGTLEAGTASLVKKMKGKEILLIPILFVLFCFGGTAFGMQEETLGLIPLIIPFLVIAGFDTMTGLLIVVVGTTSGIAASVLDPFSIGVMASSLSTPDFEVTVSTGIIIRIIMFIVFATLGSIGCMWYGHRSRKGKDYVLEPEKYEENKEWAKQHLGDIHETHDKMTKRQVIGLSLFAGTFAVMVFSLLPWTTWFPVLVADPNGFWTVFSSLFFDGAVFGEWYFLQLSMMFIIMTYISAWTFQMSVKETNSAVSSGIKGMFGVAMILVLSRSVAIILTYSGITIAMVNLMFQNVVGGEEFSEIALAWILFPIFALLAVFIPSTSGLAGITGPLIAPIINSMAGGQEELFMKYAIVVMVVYPLAQGTINMFSPTTGLVVAQAEASKVSYGKAMPILALCALITMITGMLIISTSTMFI